MKGTGIIVTTGSTTTLTKKEEEEEEESMRMVECIVQDTTHTIEKGEGGRV